MPVIQRFANCRVVINPRDHAPPHFHILLNDGREAWVAIATLEILHGKIFVREIGDVLAWAKSNQAMLADKFEELQQ
jgi:hypothetical protein